MRCVFLVLLVAASEQAPMHTLASLPIGRMSVRSSAGMQLVLRGGSGEMMEATYSSPVVSNALDCVRLFFFTGGKETDIMPSEAGMRPMYVHQIFGANETICGFVDPEISVCFAADSLLPSISFRSRSQTQGNNEHGLTNVLGKIKENAPADYVDLGDLKQAAQRNSFTLPGTVIEDYASSVLKPPASGGLAGGDVEARFEVRHIHGDQIFLRRTQCLAKWFIEKASYIDIDDQNWSCVALFERRGSGKGARSQFVGFTTLYRAGIENMEPDELQKLTPLSQEFLNKTGAVRLRIAQFLILPHFAGRGHGSRLLRAVYKLARQDPLVLDVAVEDPNDAFNALRVQCHLQYLRDHACVDAVRAAHPPWTDLQRRLKLSMPHLFALAEELGSKAGQRGVKPNATSAEWPTVAGVPVDVAWVYGRAATFGFTRAEIDDTLQGISAEDLAGVKGPQDAARRLLLALLMAVVADLGSAEGLSDDEVDALMERVDAKQVVGAESSRALAALVLPCIRKLEAERT